mgnify:CR=1 FL=1
MGLEVPPPLGVVLFGEVLAEVGPPALAAHRRRFENEARHPNGGAQLDPIEQLL